MGTAGDGCNDHPVTIATSSCECFPPGAQNVEIKYAGLREGEKLYEEVLNGLESTKPTFHEKIHIAQVREYDFDEVSREIDDLVETAKTFDKMETVRKMKHIVPEYKSNNSVYEVLDGEGEDVDEG